MCENSEEEGKDTKDDETGFDAFNIEMTPGVRQIGFVPSAPLFPGGEAGVTCFSDRSRGE